MEKEPTFTVTTPGRASHASPESSSTSSSMVKQAPGKDYTSAPEPNPASSPIPIPTQVLAPAPAPMSASAPVSSPASMPALAPVDALTTDSAQDSVSATPMGLSDGGVSRRVSNDSHTQERLSDVIQSEILQAYYANQTGHSTPSVEESRPHRMTPQPTVSSTISDLWSHTRSVTESEILRSLSMYDSEFEALISTPDFAARRSSLFGSGPSRSPIASLGLSSAKASPNPDDENASSQDPSVLSPRVPPAPPSPSNEVLPAAIDELTQLELQRHLALAELLGIQSAAQQYEASDDKSVHNRVKLVLSSLMAHLDTVKWEYRRELESLLLTRQSIQQELKPMLQVHSTLMQESQALAERIDAMTAHLSSLELSEPSSSLQPVMRTSPSTSSLSSSLPLAPAAAAAPPPLPPRSVSPSRTQPWHVSAPGGDDVRHVDAESLPAAASAAGSGAAARPGRSPRGRTGKTSTDPVSIPNHGASDHPVASDLSVHDTSLSDWSPHVTSPPLPARSPRPSLEEPQPLFSSLSSFARPSPQHEQHAPFFAPSSAPTSSYGDTPLRTSAGSPVSVMSVPSSASVHPDPEGSAHVQQPASQERAAQRPSHSRSHSAQVHLSSSSSSHAPKSGGSPELPEQELPTSPDLPPLPPVSPMATGDGQLPPDVSGSVSIQGDPSLSFSSAHTTGSGPSSAPSSISSYTPETYTPTVNATPVSAASMDTLPSASPAPPAPSTGPQTVRRDASLPPLPSPRKFRWIKPRIPAASELNALSGTLLLPAHELARTPKGASSPSYVLNNASTPKADTPPYQAGRRVNDVHPPGTSSPAVSYKPARDMQPPPVPARRVTSPPPQPLASSAAATTAHPPLSSSSPSTLALSFSSPRVLPMSRPGSKNSMMGRSLIEQVELEGNAVPELVSHCVVAIEANGLEDEGLYRKSGSSQQQRQIIQLFDSGCSFDLCDLDQFNDVSAIAGVLKSYLRELPDPLIPNESLSSFVELAEKPGALSIASMRSLLSQLPVPHYETLRRLCVHLRVIHDHNTSTRMTARNLGIVFGRAYLFFFFLSCLSPADRSQLPSCIPKSQRWNSLKRPPMPESLSVSPHNFEYI